MLQPLHELYPNLHTSVEVENAVKREEKRRACKVAVSEAEVVGQLRTHLKPAEKISAYLRRFEEILHRPDDSQREHGIEALKRLLRQRFVIRQESVPESYFDVQRRLAREEGRGDIEITNAIRRQAIAVLRADQASTLDAWVSYLCSRDAEVYPFWARYWAFRGMLSLSTFDKEKQSFGKRSSDTVAPFTELNQAALAESIGFLIRRESAEGRDLELRTRQVSNTITRLCRMAYDAQQSGAHTPVASLDSQISGADVATTKSEIKDAKAQLPNLKRAYEDHLLGQMKDAFAGDQKAVLLKAIRQGDFGKLYAFALLYVTPQEESNLRITEGEWVKYPKGSSPAPLVKSLAGYGTGWCTAAMETAKVQLELGDFYVYYSHDRDGNPKVPRAGIRMQGQQIAEVRGVAKNQNLDPYISDVVTSKLEDFPDGKVYTTKSEDMKKLTELEGKLKLGEEPTADDLRFLYEIDTDIVGFGYQFSYQKDPRIQELKQGRELKKDMALACGIREDQVAENESEVTPETVCYLGKDTITLSESTTWKELKQWAEMEGKPTVDLTEVPQRLKCRITVWNGGIVDKSGEVRYARLASLGGGLHAKEATSLSLPLLALVGGTLYIDEALSLSLPLLAEVGGALYAEGATSLLLPLLASVGGTLYAPSATHLELPLLATVEGGLSANNAAQLSLPLLTMVGGVLNAQSATSLELPRLAVVSESLDARRVESLSLPLLTKIGYRLNTLSAKKLSLPKLLEVDYILVNKDARRRVKVSKEIRGKISLHA